MTCAKEKKREHCENRSNCFTAESLGKHRNDEKEVGKKMYKMLQQCPTLWPVQSAAHREMFNRINPETNLLLTISHMIMFVFPAVDLQRFINVFWNVFFCRVPTGLLLKKLTVTMLIQTSITVTWWKPALPVHTATGGMVKTRVLMLPRQ